jgi:hypothetical protein
VTTEKAVFQLHDAALTQLAPDVFGLWTTAPSLPPEAIAFDAVSVSMADVPLWRANLPADPQQARAHLARGESMLQASQQTLAVTAERFDGFVEAQAARSAFDVVSEEEALTRLDVWLSTGLGDFQKTRTSVSFGLTKTRIGGWNQAMPQLHALMERLQRFVTDYAWVETRMQGRLLAQTTVAWRGHFSTAWQGGLDPEQVLFHQRTLMLALRSRNMLIQSFVVAIRIASKLAVLLSMPSILALPAVWWAINELLQAAPNDSP